jgi:hypothetical protein
LLKIDHLPCSARICGRREDHFTPAAVIAAFGLTLPPILPALPWLERAVARPWDRIRQSLHDQFAHVVDLDQNDEALSTYDPSDEALEAAARVDGGRVISCGVLRYRF